MVQRTTNPTQHSIQWAHHPLLINYSLISENWSNDQFNPGSRQTRSKRSILLFIHLFFHILYHSYDSILNHRSAIFSPPSIIPTSPLSFAGPLAPSFLPPLVFCPSQKTKSSLSCRKKNSKRKQALTDEKHHLPLTAPPSSLSSPSQRGK